jgi:4-hydroxybenzoate polyprenyltransferase
LRPWLQLVRAPNLFTVPGDPLAGYLIANSGIVVYSSLAAAILSSLFLYSAGLVMNDLADQAEDRRDRPARPLPSGAVAPAAAWAVMAILLAAGLLAAWYTGSRASLLCAVILVAAMALYNFAAKRWFVLGALNMGLCRSLSVLIGALAGPLAVWQRASLFTLAVGLYIAAITNLARHETRPSAPVTARLWPALFYILGSVAATVEALGADSRRPAIYLSVIGIGAVVWLAMLMFHKPAPPLPPLIGSHIRLLLILQAATCYVADPWVLGPPAALVLVLFWPASRSLGRWFYAS